MKNFLGKKVLVILVLAALLMIPLSLIEGVVNERSAYRDEARYSIAQSWSDEQTILGPLLVVPYKETVESRVWNEKLQRYEIEVETLDRIFLLAPEVLTIDGEVTTETRSRGIYEVPIYYSQLAVSGRFDLSKVADFAQTLEHKIDWQPAYLSVAISDVRGVEVQPSLNWRGQAIEFVSDTGIQDMHSGMHAPLGQLQADKAVADFDFDLKLHGMERLAFSPMGKSTKVSMQANWPDPSFFGRYLPSERAIDAKGFTAIWQVSSFSSNVSSGLAYCQTGNCSPLQQDTFGVRLFNSVDIYQQSERSVKYGLLFIGLTFVGFFLFEVMKGLRLHPMQYLLVGLGLSVFYLLLISLSEHMAFALAYTIATIASTLVIGFYVSSVLQSARQGGIITGALLLLYGMLYGILSSEDNSLLMGSLLIFGVLSLVMVVTRRLDWYAVADSMVNLAARKEDDLSTKDKPLAQ